MWYESVFQGKKKKTGMKAFFKKKKKTDCQYSQEQERKARIENRGRESNRKIMSLWNLDHQAGTPNNAQLNNYHPTEKPFLFKI